MEPIRFQDLVEASADLVERQGALQREAAEVAGDLRVEETLGRVGRVVAVGSFVTGLMVWRDLDFVVDASGLTTGAAFEVMYPLLSRSRSAHYENDAGLGRHYFVLRIPWRGDREPTRHPRRSLCSRTPGARKRRIRRSWAASRFTTPSWTAACSLSISSMRICASAPPDTRSR